MIRFDILHRDLSARLVRAGVKYFSAGELLYPGATHYAGTVKNSPPAPSLLGDLVEVAEVADDLRHAVNLPLIVLSAYRSPTYNQHIGGAPQSYHMKGRALDLCPIQPEEMPRLHYIAKELHECKMLPGGLGLYPWGVHIDTARHRSW